MATDNELFTLYRDLSQQQKEDHSKLSKQLLDTHMHLTGQLDNLKETLSKR